MTNGWASTSERDELYSEIAGLTHERDVARKACENLTAMRDALRDALDDMAEVCNEVYANTENRQDEPFIAYVRKAMSVALSYRTAVKGSANNA